MAVDDVKLGEYLRAAREARGLTIKAVADALGVDASAYSRVEAGKRALKATELVKVADTLNIALDELVQRRAAEVVERERAAKAAVAAASDALADLIAALARAADSGVDALGLVSEARGRGVFIEWPGDPETAAERGKLLETAVVELARGVRVGATRPFTGLADQPPLPHPDEL